MTSNKDEVLCERCSCVLDESEIEPIHGYQVCISCECEKFHTFCRLCDECFDEEDWEPTHFVLVEEVDGLDGVLSPGYYRIERKPVYANGLIEGFFYNDAVTRVAPLTGQEGDLAEYAAAHVLCELCTQRLVEGIHS